MRTSFYNEKELINLGLKSIGKNVLISRKASIYSPHKIAVGNNVRIDDFCILSGEIKLGTFVHIAAFCALYGRNKIIMEDYISLSAKTIIYSASDDFNGEYLFGPTVPEEFRNVKGGTVLIKRYSMIGAGSIVFPNITIGEGTAVGAMSLVNKSLSEWGIYAGIPVKFIKKRSKLLLNKQSLLSKRLKEK